MQTEQSHSDSSQRINVSLAARSYDVVVGENVIVRASDYIAPVLLSSRVVIVADETVWPLYGGALKASLTAKAIDAPHILIAPGEQSKSFSQLEKLLESLLALQPDRQTTLIALGGGVIGDLVGFAASILLRGIPFVQIPTTLLAQVDSAVGGKTAINSANGKNLIGSFYQPKLVLSDVGSLKTLPKRHLQAGYAEIVKYGLIADAAFYRWCLENGEQICEADVTALTYAIKRSCEMKAAVVAGDERESGRRAILNFGHTFAHALETELQFSDKLFHGEAVAVGMVLALKLSEKLGYTPHDLTKELAEHLDRLGIRWNMMQVAAAWDVDRLMAHMALDKKADSGRLNFVVLNALANAELCKGVTPDLVRDVLAEHISEGK